MPQYLSSEPPSSFRRTFILVSVLLHLGLGMLVLASPRVFKRKIKQVSPRFFQVVNVQVAQNRAKQRMPRAVRRKPQSPPRRTTPKPKPAPALRAGAEPDKTVTFEPESEPQLPTQVTVRDAGFQYDWYLSHLTSKVERYWQPPRGLPGENDLTVEVFFHILRNGQITNLSIQKSSGNETLDRLGLRTIRRSSPFPRLPPRFVEPALRVTFKLNYLR